MDISKSGEIIKMELDKGIMETVIEDKDTDVAGGIVS